MEIGFLGGASTVTGSKFLVHNDGTRILVDCGMFQGLKELRELNWSDFPIDPKNIDAVVLTHAHLDHCGALPLLVRKGFKGEIHCTEATLELTKIILLDSAKIQEEDAEYANKKGFSKHHPALALYTIDDVTKTLPLFRTHKVHEEFQIGSLSIELFNSGHILGASSVLVSNGEKKVYFSGDLGRNNDPLMWPPEPPQEADYIVMESTYGNRDHSEIPSKEVLKQCILEIAKSKGVLLIPSFAVGRAQNLMYEITELKRAGEVPSQIPVYLNTPMGQEISNFYELYPFFHRLGPGQFAEIMSEIHTVKTAEDSKVLNERSGPMIIIAASGMLTGGRVLHHLKAFAPNPRNILLLAGFQSAGTRGRRILDGEKEIKLHGMYVDIACKVVPSDSFSAHADRSDLMNWLKQAPKTPQKVFLVHGERSASEELEKRIKTSLNWNVEIPEMNQIIRL
ncbi:mRNA 3'-end processing factor [Bdellovibrio bacteriovorus]|uniref:mRNA 3'-end processing factor n=1 Tax=Bdellovibrio bacteriovorus TaxID=959 RepID=A0A162G8K1_BDEBC|nr:MBL fold metallo-hydrolase [Bdellovibrio bacteriovorus]KYG65284.1 mRNA 3'-end processing factor [Bdellovibrio bacteriovorus]